jgi:hypothetical protein
VELALALVTQDSGNVQAMDVFAGALNGRTEALMAAGRQADAELANQAAMQASNELVARKVEDRFSRYGREMQARWLAVALAYGKGDLSRARAELARFSADFPNPLERIELDTARWAWSVVAAMAWQDCPRADRACRKRWSDQLLALTRKQPTPREVALRRHLARLSPQEFPLPESLAPNPANEVDYPVGAILERGWN